MSEFIVSILETIGLIRPIACVFEKIHELNQKGFNEVFIDFIVNHVIWGNFQIEDDGYNMFGNSTFFIPMNYDYMLFVSTNIERYPTVDKDGSVSLNVSQYVIYRRSLVKTSNNH